jgi:hypothetical protein
MPASSSKVGNWHKMRNQRIVHVTIFKIINSMRYKALKNNYIKLEANKETFLDAGEGIILIPESNTKIYVHWLNDSGKITTTCTVDYATLVTQKVKLINAQNKEIRVHCIEIGKTNA